MVELEPDAIGSTRLHQTTTPQRLTTSSVGKVFNYSSRSSPPRSHQWFFSLGNPGRCLTKLERLYALVCPTKILNHWKWLIKSILFGTELSWKRPNTCLWFSPVPPYQGANIFYPTLTHFRLCFLYWRNNSIQGKRTLYFWVPKTRVLPQSREHLSISKGDWPQVT